MTSRVLTTVITPVLSTDDEDNQKENCLTGNDMFEGEFSSDSDSDHCLEDTRYETVADDNTLCEEALQKLKELFLRNNFNKLEIIQRKNGKNEANDQIVSHMLLIDQKADHLKAEDLSDQNSKYLFESKSKLLKECELKSKQKSEKQKKSLKSDVQINRIPKTFEEFLEIIFDMNADLIEDQNSRLFFREETHNRDIRFQSHDSYVNSFIPFVIREFWSNLKESAKGESTSLQMTYFKGEATNELILSHIRHKSCSQSMFKYGQLVVIKYPAHQNQESSEVQSRFGVIVQVQTKLIDKTSEHLSHPLILSQIQSQENDFIFEEIFVYCNPLAQTFERVSVTPLTCVQKYLLEARVVYELKEQKFEKILQQILKPIFKYGIFGLSVNLENTNRLYDIQKDSIQKAYEVCCLPPMDGFSNFVAIYGGPKTGKTEVLTEAALQLLKLADDKVDKLIIITTEVNQLLEIIETLKKEEIKVFHIDSDISNCLSHKKSDFRRLIKRMDRDNFFDDIVGKEYSIQQCLKFYNGEVQATDLLVRDQYVKEIIDKRVVVKLIGESKAIIGSIDSVMNDETFNLLFNKESENKNDIKCALVDKAHLLTETELFTLLYTGVRSFALFGDIAQIPNSYEKCESFLKRYVTLYLKTFPKTDTNNYSVLYLKESIASLERYANNKEKGAKSRNINRNNNDFGPKNSRQMINEYQKSSNYGSEYFKRNDRFKNYKPFKTESKDDIKYNGADKPFNRYAKPEQQSRSDPNQSAYPGSTNQMIDGVGSHFAFGGRDSYLSGYYNQSALNSNDMSRAGNDPNSNSNNYPSNGSQFVSNPTRHQNYN